MDVPTVLAQYGLAGLVMFVEATVIMYIYKADQKKQDKIDSIYEQRLVDAKETRDSLTEPLNAISKSSEKMYDILVNLRDKK